MAVIQLRNRWVYLKKADCRIIALLILVVVITGTCGCIRLAQQSLENGNETSLTQSNGTVSHVAGAGPFPVRTTPAAHITSTTTAGSDLQVIDAAPETTPNPYTIQHGTRINQTVLTSRYVTPSFTKTYTLRGDAYGLQVDAGEGPLYIYFTINPMYDCLNDPESCRGTVSVPVNRPYCMITVTNNQTHQIVAQDGYAREYSSDKANRSITIYGAGQYRITITGNSLDITLSVASGADRGKSTTSVPTAQQTTIPENELPPELLRRDV